MIRYVSNAGILFREATCCIGIDCLCKDSAKLYHDTPEEIRTSLLLDHLIFTHEHEDHFCAAYVKEAWCKNSNMQIYSNKKVITCLKESGIPSTNLHLVKEGDKISIGDITICIAKTKHEGEQYSDIENLTLLIKKGNEKIVVTGDAMPSEEFCERVREWSQEIDWLFAPFPYVGLRTTRKRLTEYLHIRNVFAFHQPRPEMDGQNWIGSTQRVCELAQDSLPRPIFPGTPGEWYEI